MRMLGIVEEQHPDRARLFMQWKRMDWPILIDPLNLLNVPYVPITLAVDEHGVIRVADFGYNDTSGVEERFLRPSFDAPVNPAVLGSSAQPPAASPPGGSPSAAQPPVRPDLAALEARARAGEAPAWREYAQALVLWGGPGRLGDAIEAYEQALRIDPQDGPTHFRLGVAYRMRHDSGRREPGDFQSAVDAWTRALEIDPNNYIWRRRIQQYGPRLDKPYSFYDWVNEARRDVQSRGETPVALSVEPGGAEFAYPEEIFEAARTSGDGPDPQGRVARDRQGLIKAEATLVPPAVEPGGALRAHVVFRPNPAIRAHWNNEVDDLVLWVDPPPGWEADSQRAAVARPPEPVSREARSIEVELHAPASAAPGPVTIPAYALYYVCEDVKGTCLYRRQDVSLQATVVTPSR